MEKVKTEREKSNDGATTIIIYNCGQVDITEEEGGVEIKLYLVYLAMKIVDPEGFAWRDHVGKKKHPGKK